MMKGVLRIIRTLFIITAIYIFLFNGTESTGVSSAYGITSISITGDEIFCKYPDSNKWIPFSEGLPEKVEPVYCCGNPDRFYLATQEHGLFTRSLRDRSWKNVSATCFLRKSLYEKKPSFRKISAVAVDPDNGLHVVCATKHSLYESSNGGESWTELKKYTSLKRHYITALIINRHKIYAGTSYGGVFRLDGGSARAVNRGLPYESYSEKLKFYEEIVSLDQSDSTGRIEAILAHRTDRYILHTDGWKKTGPVAIPSDMHEGWKFSRIIRNDGTTGVWINNARHDKPARDKNLRALYAGIPSSRKITNLLKSAEKCGLNSLVIDMKDDEGNILFASGNPLAAETGAIKSSADVPGMIKLVHVKKMKAIARMVVFKDRRLYRARNNRYAIHDRITGNPWYAGNREYWVDPSSPDVHGYVIDMAVELQNLGFDEIQFDYIRFPSDGDTDRCDYSDMYGKGFYSSEIIEDFLKQARDRLNVPISVDIYGFNVWYRFGNVIGQDTEEMSRIVDILCPMIYPSHFGRLFLKQNDHSRRTYDIISRSCIRGSLYTGNRCLIRPYLQAFRLLSPDWGENYILNQIRGTQDGGGTGFTFWNAAGDYGIIEKALASTDSTGM